MENQGTSPKSEQRREGFTAPHQAAEQLRSGAAEQAKHIREATDATKHRAAERVRSIQAALRQVGDSAGEQDHFVRSYATRAVQSLDRVANYVEHVEPGEVVRDAQRLARQRPALIVGGAFILGLAAGRFIKASSEDGQSSSRRGGRYARSEAGGYDSAAVQRSRELGPTAGATGTGNPDRAVARPNVLPEPAAPQAMNSSQGRPG